LIVTPIISSTAESTSTFPATRYQGSKRRLAQSIVGHIQELPFESVLDAFGGTGAVSHALKRIGKQVTYNDVLRFNYQIGLALIENDSVRLSESDTSYILRRHDDVTYGDYIERTFEDIYFTPEENRWLDRVVANIGRMDDRFKRAMAWFAVFQAAMAKRPYNLFHRRNLYMRHAEVPRGFGNKTTWDRSFEDHFTKIVRQANNALIDAGGSCRAVCCDAVEVEGEFDLVYVDTPYITARGVGVDYRDFYHFLEGMMCYDDWPSLIDLDSKHRRLRREEDPWSDPKCCHDMFRRLFERFEKSILVVSYRSDGIPSISELVEILRRVKRQVDVIDGQRYQYALSTKRDTREVLIIAR